jgi:lysophospholipase L1-like esterase
MVSKAKHLLTTLLAVLLLAFSCKPESSEPTGGETHFLTRCEPSSTSCGDRLSCVCGVCTLPCTERASCQGLPAAQCVPSCTITSPTAPGVCEVSCLGDADCTVISPAHRCQQGVCRAGSLASGGAGGSGEASDASADAGAGTCDSGIVPANQLLVIGDSFFAATHQITAYLEGLARDAGAVSVGERYRDRSSGQSNALALGGNGILDQYTSGATDAAVKVVIMNGGGADALVGTCDNANASCAVISAAAQAAQALFAKMATDNVAHVVYAFYPDPGDANVKAKIDALRPLIQNACEDAPLPCHWLDLRTVFAGHDAEYLQPDQLNPSDTGARASAAAIWAVMQQYCIAQ